VSLPPEAWYRPAGTARRGDDTIAISPADAGWTYCGLRVVTLDAGGSTIVATGTNELAVLPLGGSVTIEVAGRRHDLAGRDSVFARVTDWMYLPVDCEARLSTTTGCELALPSAVATRRFEPVHVPAEEVPVETRGAGPATRQVTNFMAPDAFRDADKLMCVELLTPDGNWSSYPPHKHDGRDGCPVDNEEIYYFRLGRTGTTDYAPDAFALHRTYTTDGQVDVDLHVRDGDVFLIPYGYHGPCVAAPGYPLYYLNVLAGPGAERTMAFCDDPTHHWVRDAWSAQAPDPRCPMTDARGVVPR
jgi:5-deoxy-glucuronate isomerase